MGTLATALLSALTSVAVVLVSFFLSSRDDRKKAARAERQELNARYLNPLRLHLAETRFRLLGGVPGLRLLTALPGQLVACRMSGYGHHSRCDLPVAGPS